MYKDRVLVRLGFVSDFAHDFAIIAVLSSVHVGFLNSLFYCPFVLTGAGSGEFHVYKQSRRREYERLKIMDEKSRKVRMYLPFRYLHFRPAPSDGLTLSELEFYCFFTSRRSMHPTVQQESEQAEFDRRKRERDEAADAKTAKNRAKRQKRKAARKKSGGKNSSGSDSDSDQGEIKKKRILGGDGKGVAFRRPGEEDDGNGDEDEEIGPSLPEHTLSAKTDTAEHAPSATVVDTPAILVHDDD